MIEIKLPFWMDGAQLAKLCAGAKAWWDHVETWIRWPLDQLDPLTCQIRLLNLLAYQRDIHRFDDEPEDLYRKRVAFAYVNAEDAGSKAGFIRIFERLGIGYVEIEERVDEVNWDVIILQLSDSQIGQNNALLHNIIQTYGRTCRRYEFSTITPIPVATPCFGNGCTYYYDVASI
jgi:P2-related tail formation protein